MSILRITILVLLLSCVPPWSPLWAQSPADMDKTRTSVVVETGTLQSLRDLIKATESRIASLQQQSADAPDAIRKEEIETRLAKERESLRSLIVDFREVASGIEESDYTMESAQTPGLPEQMRELLQPLLGELREATSGPREMETMRKQLRDARARWSLANRALEKIRGFDPAADDPELQRLLDETRRLWEQRAGESAGRVKVLELQLAERERERVPFLEKASAVFSSFWRTRGLNLLLALSTGVATFLLGRRAYRWLRRHSPLHRRKGEHLMTRATDIVMAAVLVVSSILAALIVLYVREDWLLLTLAAIVLIGLAWAGRNTLPPYVDQIRLLLNLGPVREGERIVINGLPWRVSRLGFYSELTNPELHGGVLRLPVQDLTSLRSRPHDPHEPWFPTRIDDWVMLGDGTYGKVVQQTPEQVVLVRLGGSFKTYTAADFIRQTPENLSRNFRISTPFGIDYRHQAESTTAIPQRLTAAVKAALLAEVGNEHLRHVQVELQSAGASSLDYVILADFSGETASRLNVLTRLIVRTCVDTCNAEGWVIPFTQVTVHQADH